MSPAFANGTLVAEKTTIRVRQVVYFISGGQRRRVPDAETLAAMVTGGAQVQDLAPADLAAIPEGGPLPTRRDGTLYRGTSGGTGATYAFLLQGGHKQAVPDATTLRDAGHDVSGLITIPASDLADIPDGAPLPSTSRFLKPPAAGLPLVLLPVRLETRFQGAELWVRVYPDDVHVNSFEPELTAEESAARAGYLAQAGGEDGAGAFATLARQFGPERAAWIVSPVAQPGTKAGPWTLAPFTNVLPERWIVIGYQGNAAGVVLAVGAPIQDSLPVGPAPDGPGPATDEGMRWVADFDHAVQAGMALRIPLTGAQTRGFSRIVVLGLRSGLDPAAAAGRLGDLLQAHHYTDGLELLPHGAPTNNTADVKSALASRDPNFAALFAVEQGPPLCPTRPTSDGDRLARALGVPPGLLAHVRGADGDQDEQAAAINTVLWPATWGYYLDQIVTGAVPNPDVLLPAARDHFTEHVRARGHFPILRAGRQPYGILPVCWSARWQPLEGRALDAPLAALLTRLRTTWESSVANVPRLPGAADGEAALVSLLGMSPSSTSYVARSVIGPEYNLTYWRFVQQDLGKAWWTALAAKSLAQTGDLATVMANTRLASATFVKEDRPLSDLLVAPAPLDGQPAPAFIAQLAQPAFGWQNLRDLTPAPPVPLLLLLLRHAALRQYLETAFQLLAQAGAAQPAERLEPEMIGFAAAQARPSAWDLLQRNLPGHGPVGAFLDGAKADPTLGAFTGFWSAFTRLSTLSAEALDFATREVLDLAAYRFDAWVTSLAHFRLDETRGAAPDGGIVLGAYGWLEDVTPQPQASSTGYVHAPSPAHATTAAVLRSGYLTHQDGARKPMEIDLSSDRVRLGLHLLDGIRAGQPLGALLGYRLERSMHDAGLDPYIDTLRALAPLDGSPPAETGTSEAVAPNDVVDGLALLRRFHADPDELWSSPGLPAGGDRDKLEAALGRLDDALDAVADLTLAESVHQLLRGNTLRAGATLDAIARGDTPPPELDVVRTPRAGTALTQRLLAVAVGNDSPGWGTTPRAQAEPRLNSWAAALLGDPARVRARARFVDAAGAVAGTAEIGLDRLGLAPLDLLELPESDGSAGELADRLRRSLAAARPPSVPAAAAVELVAERDASWTPDVVSITEWLGLLQAVSRLVGASRAVEPRDLVAPGDPPGAVDTAELQARADAAEAQLRSAYAALQAGGGAEAALLAAAGFGVAGAVPALDASQWSAQAGAAATELASRIDKLTRLAAGFVRSTAPPEAARDQDVARLKAIFGDSFPVLPALAPALAATWPGLWGSSASLQAGDPLAAVRWLQRMSRVRPGAARLDQALLCAEALAGKPLARLDVAQLPQVAGERWLGLDLAGGAPASRLSLVAFSPRPYSGGATVAGLMIDEWVEVLPAAQQITGLSFHHDDPAARAPQAILLAVRPDDFPEWTLEAVEGSVLEALDLAKLRAVDPDALGALGHYLPALYFAYNAGGPQAEAVSTDFNLALRATAALKNP